MNGMTSVADQMAADRRLMKEKSDSCSIVWLPHLSKIIIPNIIDLLSYL